MPIKALAAVSAIGSALGKQTRPTVRAPRPPLPEASTAIIAASPNIKTAKLALKNAREERLLYVLAQPEIVGLATVFGGLFLANKIPFSDVEPQNSAIQGVAATTAILMGLGHAGVGDLTSLTMAGLGGAATLSTGITGADRSLWTTLLGSTFPPLGLWNSIRDLLGMGG